jgi:hypothetical protein
VSHEEGVNNGVAPDQGVTGPLQLLAGSTSTTLASLPGDENMTFNRRISAAC